MLQILSLLVCMCFDDGFAQSYGDPCSQHGVPGRCLDFSSCPTVRADRRAAWKLQRCGFVGDEPIVCCLDRAVLGAGAAATPSPYSGSTTEYVPALNDYVENNRNGGRAGGCAPIPKNKTAEKTGRKAWDKCIEYQEKLLYPCQRGVDFLGKMSRGNNCNHKADALIVGGMDANPLEFPHMALLGYGESAETALYQCGGTVISERFILTAGHCTSAPRLGKVSFAKVGILRRSEPAPEPRVHRVRRVIKHPQYKPPDKYNDIALLETERAITLDASTVPACVDVGAGVADARASVTGWGDVRKLGPSSDVLQKVTLTKFSSEQCARKYRPQRYILQGFHEPTQVCYGDHEGKKDTCQGDSGGPLQVNNALVHCMYTVVGVTSFGKDCGQPDQPGMYTRVAPYAAWIEGEVWP